VCIIELIIGGGVGKGEGEMGERECKREKGGFSFVVIN